MPSTYSQNLRIELIASGEQGNTWGNTTNNNLGTLIEQAISGYSSISTVWSGNACTLVALNGANDQARNMFLEIPSSVSLSAEGQLTAPTVPKMYVIKNASSGGYAVRIKTGSSAASCLIPNGTTKVVVCDGTEFYEATTAAADFYIANAPTLASQATNKSYVDTADDLRLKRDGSQNMTGELELSAGTVPLKALAAVSRQYVQATFLPLTGGTLSGALTLPSVAPSSTWQAAPKTYVDSLIPGIATTSSLGTVKVGSGLAVAVDGTLSATGTAGVGSIAVTSPIQNTGTATNVALSMISNAYYPYTGNPSEFLTSSALSGYATQTFVTSQGYITSAALSGYATTASLSAYLPLSAGSSKPLTDYLYIGTSGNSRKAITGVFLNAGTYYPGIATYESSGSAYAPFVIVQQNNAGIVIKYNLTTAGAHIFSGDLAVSGNLSASGTKPFCIDHPILEDKKLYHVAVEAPRNDLIYRGKTSLIDGQAIVNIDAESRMTSGTFVALTQNAEVVGLHNASSFGRVRASAVVDGHFTIYAEEANSTDEIAWIVMAERNDAGMHGNALCDGNGRLVPEQPKPEE